MKEISIVVFLVSTFLCASFTYAGSREAVLGYHDETERMDKLLGIDSNHNGIRDDYEKAVVSGDLPESVKPYALAAGKVYGKLIKTAADDFQVTPGTAQNVLEKILLASACKREIQQLHKGQAWQESAYFNTLDRIEAKYKLQNRLVKVVSEKMISYPESAPCNALLSISVGMLSRGYREIVLVADTDQSLSRPLVSMVLMAKYQVPSPSPAISYSIN